LGDIAKYDGLRFEDQQIIKAQLGMSNGETPPPGMHTLLSIILINII
jgi:hypothetical protein